MEIGLFYLHTITIPIPRTMSDQEEPEMKRMRMSEFLPNGDWNHGRTLYVLMALNRLLARCGIYPPFYYSRRIIVYVRHLRQVGCDVHYWDPCFCPVRRLRQWNAAPPSPTQTSAPPSPPQSFWDSIPEQLLNGPPSSDDDDTAE